MSWKKELGKVQRATGHSWWRVGDPCYKLKSDVIIYNLIFVFLDDIGPTLIWIRIGGKFTTQTSVKSIPVHFCNITKSTTKVSPNSKTFTEVLKKLNTFKRDVFLRGISASFSRRWAPARLRLQTWNEPLALCTLQAAAFACIMQMSCAILLKLFHPSCICSAPIVTADCGCSLHCPSLHPLKPPTSKPSLLFFCLDQPFRSGWRNHRFLPLWEKLPRAAGLSSTLVNCLRDAGREQSQVFAVVMGSVGKSHSFRLHYDLVRSWKSVGRIKSISIQSDAPMCLCILAFLASRLLAVCRWAPGWSEIGGRKGLMWINANEVTESAAVISVKMSFLIKNRRPVQVILSGRGCQIGRGWGLAAVTATISRRTVILMLEWMN